MTRTQAPGLQAPEGTPTWDPRVSGGSRARLAHRPHEPCAPRAFAGPFLSTLRAGAPGPEVLTAEASRASCREHGAKRSPQTSVRREEALEAVEGKSDWPLTAFRSTSVKLSRENNETRDRAWQPGVLWASGSEGGPRTPGLSAWPVRAAGSWQPERAGPKSHLRPQPGAQTHSSVLWAPRRDSPALPHAARRAAQTLVQFAQSFKCLD